MWEVWRPLSWSVPVCTVLEWISSVPPGNVSLRMCGVFAEAEGLKCLDLGVDNEMVKAAPWVWVPSLKPLLNSEERQYHTRGSQEQGPAEAMSLLQGSQVWGVNPV